MAGPKDNYLLTLLTSDGPVMALGGVITTNDTDAMLEAAKAVKSRFDRGELAHDDTVIIHSPDDREIGRQTVAELAGK